MTKRWRTLILVVIVAVGLVAIRVGRSNPPANPAPQPSATSTFRDYQMRPSAELVAVAETFTRQYVKGSSLPRQEWLDGLRPVTTPKLLEGLAATDPANLPTGEFRWAFIQEQAFGGGLVKVTLATPAGLRDYKVGLTTLSDEPVRVGSVEPY